MIRGLHRNNVGICFKDGGRAFVDPIQVRFRLYLACLSSGLFFQRSNHMFLSPLKFNRPIGSNFRFGYNRRWRCIGIAVGRSGLSAALSAACVRRIMAVLNVKYGVPGPIAVLAGLLAGLAVGLFQGIWVTRFKIPSFIITLAGQIGWIGACRLYWARRAM